MPVTNVRLNGMVFSGFSIQHTGGTTGSDFYLPEVTSLLVDNVCSTGSNNVFDFGDYLSASSWGAITIRDSTCPYQFVGHFLAVHGKGGDLTVSNNLLAAGVAGGAGLGLDTSDMTNVYAGAAGNMTWTENVMENLNIGMFLFLGGPGMGMNGPGIQDSQWRENQYDNCVFACYYFGADTFTGGMSPDFGHVTMADRTATSQYDAIDFNGGFYTTAGIEGIQVGGPSSYAGSSGGTASSLLMLRGSPASGDQIWITWAPGSGSGSYTHYTVVGTPNISTVTQGLSAMIAGIAPSPKPHLVPLASVNYGLIGLTLQATPMPGSYNAAPYLILINSTSSIKPVGLHTDTGVLCVPPGSVPVTCYDAAFDNGDGIAVRNGAHDIDVIGARVISSAGASIHVWPDGGDTLHFLSNVLGQDGSTSSYTGIQLDTPITAPPLDYHIAGNDLVGASKGIVNNVPPPTFGVGVFPAAVRLHRGASGAGFTGSSSSSPLTITNSGPADCTYYFDWSQVSSVALTLLYQTTSSSPATAAPITTSPLPAQITLPVGSSLTVTFSGGGVRHMVNYSGFCQP